MPRRLSDDTSFILRWLWRLPWACAADIARITGLHENVVSNVSKPPKEGGMARGSPHRPYARRGGPVRIFH